MLSERQGSRLVRARKRRPCARCFKTLIVLARNGQTNAEPNIKQARKCFNFKHFTVYQDQCAMKVGTDAMLLGSWASPPSTRPCRILDVGTGTGVLALMMAQKTETFQTPSTSSLDPTAGPTTAGIDDNNPNLRATCCNVDAGASALDGGGSGAIADGGNTAAAAYILAIDVDEGACKQAAENAALSPWSGRIRVMHSSLQQLVKVAAVAAANAAEAVAEAPAARRETSGSLGTATLTDVSTAAAVTATALPSSPSPSPSSDPAYPSPSVMPSTCNAAPLHTLRSPSHLPITSAPSAPSLECSETSITTADMGPFDLIMSNPPYFVASSKPAQGRNTRATARHADVSLPFADLAAGCAALLAPHGSICVVLPPDEAERFCAAAALCGLVLVDQVRVYTTPEDSRERRRLMRLVRAIDMPGSAVQPSSTPAATTSTLVINGPKQRSQPPPQPPTVGATFATTRTTDDVSSRKNASQRSPAAATDPATETPNAETPDISNTQPTRLFTTQYLNLTKDFHHPAYFSSLAAASGSGSGIEMVVSS